MGPDGWESSKLASARSGPIFRGFRLRTLNQTFCPGWGFSPSRAALGAVGVLTATPQSWSAGPTVAKFRPYLQDL